MTHSVNNTATAYIFILRDHFDSTMLSVLNEAIISGGGRVSTANLAFRRSCEYGFIDERGMPYDREALLKACEFEIDRRKKAGTFK